MSRHNLFPLRESPTEAGKHSIHCMYTPLPTLPNLTAFVWFKVVLIGCHGFSGECSQSLITTVQERLFHSSISPAPLFLPSSVPSLPPPFSRSQVNGRKPRPGHKAQGEWDEEERERDAIHTRHTPRTTLTHTHTAVCQTTLRWDQVTHCFF